MAAPPTGKKEKPTARHRMSSRNGAERSAYFARREAATVLRTVLRGDSRRRATASIKSLVFSPSVRNKKATFALVCQTLKCLPILKNALAPVDLSSRKWKNQEELIYITAYDILFGQGIAMTGPVEKFLMHHKDALQSALAKICVREKVKPEDLFRNSQSSAFPRPRYVRVNTLKMDCESAIQELESAYMVKKDDMVPDLLVLPSGTDLHDHPLVVSGKIFLQGKASSMPAVALNPNPRWKVIDACAAPGNKTSHLAALMKGKGSILAYEIHSERVRILKDTILRSGAPNVNVMHGDFLDIKNNDPMFSEIRAILLDPSCSGSGICAERLDYLLPSYTKGHDSDAANSERTKKLAAFQRKALLHALSFPAVERIVYSTCSVHQTENEDVINSVLPYASSLNFELATPFPQWPRRGLPVFDGAEHLLRTDPAEDTEGFFIALFVRKCAKEKTVELSTRRRSPCSEKKTRGYQKRSAVPYFPFKRIFLGNLHRSLSRKNGTRKKRKIDCERRSSEQREAEHGSSD